MNRGHPIALLTDFGVDGYYQGVMKGVILSINPNAQIVDLDHGIRAGALEEAGYVLASSYRFFPESTIFCCVVDPGVGGPRRAFVVETRLYTFIGPDNGLLTPILRREPDGRIFEVTDSAFCLPSRSTTFHGRDVFAPVAAHLSLGLLAKDVGPAVTSPVLLETTDLTLDDQGLRGSVIYIDPFGNVITNIHRDAFTPFLVRGGFVIVFGKHKVDEVQRTYGEAKRGELIAIFSSSGHLELAVRDGRADDLVKAKIGDPIYVRFRKTAAKARS